MSRAQRLQKSHRYILTTTGPIVLKFGMQLETQQLIRFLRTRSLIAQKASYWFRAVDNIPLACLTLRRTVNKQSDDLNRAPARSLEGTF